MAIAIKSVPVLKGKAAVTFEKNVAKNALQKGTINFSEQQNIAAKILAKAKF